MLIKEKDDLSNFFNFIFDFIRDKRIHSTVDHQSNYDDIRNAIFESRLNVFRYNTRFDSYSFFMENNDNYLADLIFIFVFGNQKDNQILIKVNNAKIYFELVLTDNEKHIPLMHYEKKNVFEKSIFLKLSDKIINFLVKKSRTRKKNIEEMTFTELRTYFENNKYQRGFKKR